MAFAKTAEFLPWGSQLYGTAWWNATRQRKGMPAQPLPWHTKAAPQPSPAATSLPLNCKHQRCSFSWGKQRHSWNLPAQPRAAEQELWVWAPEQPSEAVSSKDLSGWRKPVLLSVEPVPSNNVGFNAQGSAASVVLRNTKFNILKFHLN